jgi:type I restriction enzyme R subunit
VLFMRAVKLRTFFEQMKGRGVRIISPHDLQAVTPDAKVKDHFVIVDAVGVCERDKTDSRPMDQKKSVPFDKLLQAVALANTEPEVLSSVAARLSRLDKSLSKSDKARVAQASGGATLKALALGIVAALNPDESPNSASLLVLQAVKPLCDPKLRNLLIELKKQSEQVVDSPTHPTRQAQEPLRSLIYRTPVRQAT